MRRAAIQWLPASGAAKLSLSHFIPLSAGRTRHILQRKRVASSRSYAV
jgi:hypothetical protein